jgi:hypothetical protein
MRLFGWMIFPLLFLGCKNPDSPLPYPLTISPEGVGAIHLGGTFDIPLLQGKLPGFELEKLSEVTSATGQTIVRLKRHDEPLALILSDSSGVTITQIIVLSPLIKDTKKLGINDMLPPSEELHCVKDQCTYTANPTITYAIRPDTHTIREINLQQL